MARLERLDIIRRLDAAPPELARLTLQATEITGSPDAVTRARDAFDREHAVRLPRLLAPDLLSFVQREIALAGFHTRVHDTLPSRPTDLVLNPSLGLGMLLLAVNDAPFVALARRVTGRGDIRSFGGAIHRRVPRAGHEDAWHDDMSDGRVAVLSINLSTEPYLGGVLQIREGPDGPILGSYVNTVPGDAILFKIDSTLKHRVTPLEGDAARTVFAGWFRTEAVQRLFGLDAV